MKNTNAFLKEEFTKLVAGYGHAAIADELWTELEKAYSGKGRHYHTLEHLDNLFTQLSEIQTQLNDRNAVLFSLFYHDAVYNVLRSDNEEKSALLAEKRMKQMAVPVETIEKCKAQILATKAHLFTDDSDTAFFTDADLSVLGATPETYTNYYRQVRKEYSIYPDMVYKPGRKKVLRHFLDMERIFSTGHFYEKFEAQARINLKAELELL